MKKTINLTLIIFMCLFPGVAFSATSVPMRNICSIPGNIISISVVYGNIKWYLGQEGEQYSGEVWVQPDKTDYYNFPIAAIYFTPSQDSGLGLYPITWYGFVRP